MDTQCPASDDFALGLLAFMQDCVTSETQHKDPDPQDLFAHISNDIKSLNNAVTEVTSATEKATSEANANPFSPEVICYFFLESAMAQRDLWEKMFALRLEVQTASAWAESDTAVQSIRATCETELGQIEDLICDLGKVLQHMRTYMAAARSDLAPYVPDVPLAFSDADPRLFETPSETNELAQCFERWKAETGSICETTNAHSRIDLKNSRAKHLHTMGELNTLSNEARRLTDEISRMCSQSPTMAQVHTLLGCNAQLIELAAAFVKSKAVTYEQYRNLVKQSDVVDPADTMQD